jgi:hypothetical protein
MATITLDQKRLEQLRTQLYGKPDLEKPKKLKKGDKEEKITGKATITPHPASQFGSSSFIKKDLTKVFALSSLILLLQLTIYYALANNWISINIYGITY